MGFSSETHLPFASFKEISARPDKGYDPLLDIYHNTRHASRRHAVLADKQGWHLRSPWLSRFDWILDAHLEADYPHRDDLFLTKQRRNPRTVFVRCGLLDVFVREVLPTITNRIVLYIGNGDAPLSACGVDIERLVRHPVVHRVFAENKDIDVDAVIAMPVGMHPAEIMRGNAVLGLRQIAAEVKTDRKENKVFGHWDEENTGFQGGNDRELIRQFMQVNPDLCEYRQFVEPQDFWRTMSGFRFMFSPCGQLPDTARTFEALIVKTIPIIMAGPYAEAYRGLPVVVIEDLREINAENLERWWRSLSGRFDDCSFVHSDYWWHRLEQAMPARKRAFLVLGPESHGNHLVTDILVHAGCHGHSGDHGSWHEEGKQDVHGDGQPWDLGLPTDQDPIVWRRSVPHLGNFPDINDMIESLEARDYAVTGVVVTREPHAALQSQLKWGHVESRAMGRVNIEKAYKHIFLQLAQSNVHFVVTSYEALVNYPEVQNLLLQQLSLEVPSKGLPVWDGNRKWYDIIERSDRNERAAAAPVSGSRVSDFPESWFTCYEPDYQHRVILGKQRMQASRAVFCGLARDAEKELAVVARRIESAGTLFLDYRVVIYENDSRDDTLGFLRAWQRENPRVTVLHEDLNTPCWGSVRDPERMEQMAYCRNQYLDHVAQQYPQFDYVIVLDTDLPKGFSYEGLASTFGHEGWDVVGSNGLLVPPSGKPPPDPMFYDAWAFRPEGDPEVQPFDAVNRLQFRRGGALVPVWSCFGGLAVYRMACMLGTARYGGDDCEHVVFHRRLRESGLDKQFLNPSQLVFYSGTDPADS